MRILSILLLLLLCCIPSLRAQSVKEVMQDKSGKYLYSVVRDSDIKVAYEMAHSELLKQVNQWSAASGVAVPADVADVQAHIHRINGEVLGQHRVFLFVATETLRSGVPPEASMPDEPAAAPAAPAKSPQGVSPAQPAKVPAEAQASEPEEAHIQIAIEPAGPAAEAPVEEELECEEPEEVWLEPAPQGVTTSQGISASQDAQEYIPSGRIGSTISALLRCKSERELVECLAGEKNSRGVSVYGKGYTKYARHAFLVSVSGGVARVLSPVLSNGTRTEYPSGKSLPSPDDLKSYYWFLKK